MTVIRMSEKRLVPKLRFCMFTSVWEQHKLKNVAPLQRGFDLPKVKIKEGPYPVLFSNGIGGWNSEYKAKAPGVVTGRSGSIGNVVFIEQNYWPHNTSLWVTNFFDNYPRYVYYLYQHIDLSKFGTGSGVPTLNRNDVHDYSVIIPHSEEQTRIANFFKNIDDIIALQQQLLNDHKQLKKAMLQKMFPKKEETVPIIRFSDFVDEWKESNLGSIAEMYQPQTISKDDLIDIGIPVFGANGYIGYYNSENHKNDQVTISARGEKAGNPSFVKGPVWITGNSMVINIDKNNDMDKYFLFQSLLSSSLKKFVTGGAQPQLTRDVLIKVPIKISEINEQQKIGDFFKQLDKTIDLHQKKLETYQELKKAMLQKMFV